MSSSRFFLFILLSAILFALFMYWNFPSKTSETQVLVFPQPRNLNAFQVGTSFSEKNLAKHWTFLFFGFTHCSEVCPRTLHELKEVDHALRTRFPELQVVFVSIDPKRDHQAALHHYLASFDSHFIGLQGTEAETKHLQEQFGVVVEEDSQTPANINHSNSLFLINPEGQWIAVFPYGMSAQAIQDHFQTIFEQSNHA